MSHPFSEHLPWPTGPKLTRFVEKANEELNGLVRTESPFAQNKECRRLAALADIFSNLRRSFAKFSQFLSHIHKFPRYVF